MIDLIPDSFNDADKQIVGAIVGALIGSLVGAIAGSLGTYKVGENARKKQINQNEVDHNRQKIKANTSAMAQAENNLHNLLILCLKNMGHTRDITKGIIDEKINKTVFTMNLPCPYTIVPNVADGLLNIELVVQWSALETETILHNSNINEFNSYYMFLRSNIHTARISGNNLNMDTLQSDNRTVKKGAKQQLQALEYYRQRCIKVLAMLELYVEQQKKTINYTDITLIEIKRYVKKLITYKSTAKVLDNKISELNKKFTEENAFKVDVVS